jgi:hypothetical protein
MLFWLRNLGPICMITNMYFYMSVFISLEIPRLFLQPSCEDDFILYTLAMSKTISKTEVWILSKNLVLSLMHPISICYNPYSQMIMPLKNCVCSVLISFFLFPLFWFREAIELLLGRYKILVQHDCCYLPFLETLSFNIQTVCQQSWT